MRLKWPQGDQIMAIIRNRRQRAPPSQQQLENPQLTPP